MVGVDIDPFGEHDKIDSHPDETGHTLFLSTQEEKRWEEDPVGTRT